MFDRRGEVRQRTGAREGFGDVGRFWSGRQCRNGASEEVWAPVMVR